MEQVFIAERLQKLEAFRIDLGAMEMVGPVAHGVLNVRREVDADPRDKIGNVFVGERNLSERDLAHILVKRVHHRF